MLSQCLVCFGGHCSRAPSGGLSSIPTAARDLGGVCLGLFELSSKKSNPTEPKGVRWLCALPKPSSETGILGKAPWGVLPAASRDSERNVFYIGHFLDVNYEQTAMVGFVWSPAPPLPYADDQLDSRRWPGLPPPPVLLPVAGSRLRSILLRCALA
jgi:hypothetical protein